MRAKSLKVTSPIVAKEFSVYLNNGLTANDISSATTKKYWFICSKKHTWRSNVRHRVERGYGCPYCSNQKVCVDNCLDTRYPKIAKEWHPSKNGKITPKDITSGTQKNYWFQCSKGHEWKASPGNRTRQDQQCPYCSNKKACKDNCLTTEYPEIAKEWHPSKNGKRTPADVVSKSNHKIWFQCKQGHEWKTTLSHRTLGQTGCPSCSNRKLTKENSLSSMFPKVAAEWHKTKNKNLTPNMVVGGSNKSFWFQCSNGHEWKTSLSNRTTGGNTGCPYCLNKKVCKDNCLKTLYPEIAKEWHPSKNGKIKPNKITPGSNKRIYFQCKQGHEWRTSLFNRVSHGSNCPHCKINKTENKVREIFESIFNKKFKPLQPPFLGRQSFDGANENLKLAFEYDGEFHDVPHFGVKGEVNKKKSLLQSKKLDNRKNRLSKNHGWTLIRIHHSKKDELTKTIISKLRKLNLLPNGSV